MVFPELTVAEGELSDVESWAPNRAYLATVWLGVPTADITNIRKRCTLISAKMRKDSFEWIFLCRALDDSTLKDQGLVQLPSLGYLGVGGR